MPILDLNQPPDTGDSPAPPKPVIMSYDDGYSLMIGEQECESVPYGEPLEMDHGGDHWIAYCDLDLESDEVFTTLEFYAYCNGQGVDVPIEDVEDEDGAGDDDEDTVMEADPHAVVVDEDEYNNQTKEQ